MTIKIFSIITFLILKHVAYKFLIVLPMMILGAIILLPYFLVKAKDYQKPMPQFLVWFGNSMKNSLMFGGRVGDNENYERVRARGQHPSQWWPQYTWNALRNPADYFRARVMGAPAEAPGFAWNIIYENKNKTFKLVRDRVHRRYFFEYYSRIDWSKKFTVRMRIGHILPSDMEMGYRLYKYEFSINPFHPRETP